MILPRWRREQKARQRKKWAIFFRLVAIVLVTALLAGSGLFLLGQLRFSQLPNASRTTIVLRTSPLLVLSFDPEGKLTILSIPEKTYVEVPHGFGSYRLGAVWDLGEQEKMGGKLLGETIEELLAVPIDGWIGTNESLPIANTQEQILSLRNSLTSWGIFLKPKELLGTLRSWRTNFTIFDLARIWFWAKNIRFDKIYFLDLEKTSVLSPLVLADGSQAKTLDQSLLDMTTEGLFKNMKVVDEQILIEVLNGGERSGLASRVARFITHLGGKVIKVGNSPEKVSHCQIKGESKAVASLTAWQLTRVFQCQTVAEKLDSRADLQIIIGDDYWQKLFQK